MISNDDSPASPPCSLHEWQAEDQPAAGGDVDAWRNAERVRLRALARSGSDAGRRDADERIAAALLRHVTSALQDKKEREDSDCIALFWPLAHEPDLRSICEPLAGQGLQLALPVVTEHHAALRFRRWDPGSGMAPDLLGIPAPQGREVVPGILVAPCVGFDERCYRLGNGGGYYDRTLAAYPVRPLFIGVAYDACRLRSIFPQPHDIPMHAVITESGLWQAELAEP